MIVSGMNKLTLIDYPNKTACIIFTQGCNFRCPFCQNGSLLDFSLKVNIKEKEILDYLNKRKKVIDGICISGGEPLIQEDIEDFIRKVKTIGLLVKLDTNGSNPNKLKKLIDNNLIDYVAMDIKNDFENYNKTAGVNKLDIKKIKKSIDILKKSKKDYEFRTTIVKELHNINSLEKICNYIGKESKYYIQNYNYSDGVLDKSLNGFTNKELLEIETKLKEKYPKVKVRDI